MKPSLCGRADLIRALARNDPSLTAAMAEILDYHETLVTAHKPELPFPETVQPDQTAVHVGEQTTYQPADVPFWRLETYEATSLDDSPPPPSTRASTDLDWRNRPTTVPGFSPLASRRLILTRLRQVSATRRATDEIDEEAVVERLSRGLTLSDPIPRRQRRTWGSEIYIVEDRARRLVPYWLDQDYVTDILWRLYPPNGVTVARIGDGDSYPVIHWPEDRYGQHAFPLPGTMVLVLGDLGCLASQGDSLQRFWLRWGRQLKENQNPTVALIPGQIKDIPPELARTWTVVRWDAASAAIEDIPSDTVRTVVERLLTLCSPAVRLEPGLLRAVRCLLPEGRRDAGLEARVWQDAAVSSQHSVAATLDPEQRKVYQAGFGEQPESIRQSVLDLVRAWRASLHAAIWFEEIVGLNPDAQRELVDADDREDAVTFLRGLADKHSKPEQLSVDIVAWICRLAERLPAAAFHDPQVRDAVHKMYDLVRPHAAETEAPAWYDPAVVSPAGQTVRQVALWQVADRLFLRAAELPPSADDPPVVHGSPLGVLQTASGEVKIGAVRQEWSANAFWKTVQPPDWASRWGHDEFGPWAVFCVGAVDQRLRWILPGRFLMGSPDDEDGRYEDEGPRHEVQLTRGFWFFDTPCTQALWRAVMDTNPSQCPGEERPVEQVSWEECHEFITKLNERLPGLELCLPTEAQWEYACRAGTKTARYQVDLDWISWFDKTSGSQTREVGQKAPNVWGLYDMLENVDEWCHDGRRDYTDANVVDPVELTELGADRVIRGGGWHSSVRHMRAAYRDWLPPGARYGDLGFRCSSSGESQPARAAWSGLTRRARLAATATLTPAARLLNVHRQPSIDTVIPDADGFAVSTDRDRLRFRRITCPPWATEIGRDAYGLWVTLDVDGVRQRMRWITPGRFWMGSPEDDPESIDRERPRHEVQLTRGFWLFDTPCTQALWRVVMHTSPSRFEGEHRPVENVSWDDCQMFVTALNHRYDGLALSLPTEAEWEYGCRAGTTKPRYAADLDGIAWYYKNSGRETHEVGKKMSSAWGLYDMLGNVHEWCHDGQREYADESVVDPVGPTDAGADRVIRGGSWLWVAQDVRAAYRGWLVPGRRNDDLGFRCSSSGQASRQECGVT